MLKYMQAQQRQITKLYPLLDHPSKQPKTGPETAVDQVHLEMLGVVLSTILLAEA